MSHVKLASSFLAVGVFSFTCHYGLIRMIGNVPDSRIPGISDNPNISEQEKKHIRSEYVSEKIKKLMIMSSK
jgi:hypothetical protein